MHGDAHLSGQGCGKCKNSVLKSMDQFIKDANLKHNNKYDYSLVNYVNSKTSVIIICPVHGIFKQTPDNHLSGHGCRECSIATNANKMTNAASNEFIDKANLVHNDKYKYIDSVYTKAKENIKIICNTHGEFYQTLMIIYQVKDVQNAVLIYQ
jgi:hypothetical protein